MDESNVLNNLIHMNLFCTLCLKVYDNKFEKFRNIFDKFYCNGTETKINKIILYIIGSEFCNLLPTSHICLDCLQSVIKSFNFIKMCKENCGLVQNLVHNVLMSLEVKTEMCSSVLIALNKKESSYKKVLYKHAVTRSEIINDIQTLNNKNLKPEDQSTNMALAPILSPRRYKNKVKKLEPQLPFSNIMVDINDTTNLKCKLCQRKNKNLLDLKNHYYRVHAPKKFQCLKCAKAFGSNELLSRHCKYYHVSLLCSDCGKSFKSKKSLKRHEQNHNTLLKITCEHCGKTYKNRTTYNSHFKENICNQITRKSNLNAKYVCNYCNKKYSYKSALTVHIKYLHGDGEPFICKWCNKKFHAISLLNGHIVKHTRDKNFACAVCSNKFVSKSSLLSHSRIHTGEKPYACKLCDLKFSSSSRRADHVRRFHMAPSLKCDICSKKFHCHSGLSRHKQRHFNPHSKLSVIS